MGVAIVTGSSTGIGRSVAIVLGRAGHSVVVNSLRDVSGGEETVELIAAEGGHATYQQADVSTELGVESVYGAAAEHFGAPTILVNNAGASRPVPLGEWTAEHWHDMLQTNLVSTALMCQEFVRSIAEGEDGSIVNIASMRGLSHAARISRAAYCAAKAGVINLSTALARGLAPAITVNAISPGFVRTAYMERVDPAMKEQWLSEVPSGRFLESDEIARVVAFLIKARGITGSNIVIDGGVTILPGA